MSDRHSPDFFFLKTGTDRNRFHLPRGREDGRNLRGRRGLGYLSPSGRQRRTSFSRRSTLIFFAKSENVLTFFLKTGMDRTFSSWKSPCLRKRFHLPRGKDGRNLRGERGHGFNCSGEQVFGFNCASSSGRRRRTSSGRSTQLLTFFSFVKASGSELRL